MPSSVVVPDASVLLKWALPSQDEPETDQALLTRLVRGANIASLPQTCPTSVAEVLQYGLGVVSTYGDQRPSMTGLVDLAEDRAARVSAQAVSEAIHRTMSLPPMADHTLVVEFPETF